MQAAIGVRSMPSDPQPADSLALRHAEALLQALGIAATPTVRADHPALGWHRAGLMAITGRADGPGLVAPVALTAAADGALAALQAIAPDAILPDNGALLLGERARLLGLGRRGRGSANGACRLVDAQGGRFALNLARPEDWESIPALLGAPATDWTGVEALAARQSRDAIVAQGRLLGLAIAPDERPAPPTAPFAIACLAWPAPRPGPPLVVDLSALWAGPLAGSLLAMAGARVVKVESRRRPDGARNGDLRFFDLMHGGKASIALDFADPSDRARLHALIAAADIVIEGSRPRALAQLGIDAAAQARRGATWVSITAYGRTGDAADWIGFGDDAAVAGGLSSAMARGWDEPLFAGDAIADPLTGLTAALAAWAGWRQGGGWLVDVPLSRVIAHACALYEAGPEELRNWQTLAQADAAPRYPMRTPSGHARMIGADNGLLTGLIGD